MHYVRDYALAGLAFLSAFAGAQQVSAASHDQIVEACRQSVGRPIVMECMAGNKNGDREACRAKASPQVRACVIREEQKIAAGKAAPAAPKADNSAPGDAPLAPAAFVAPPRTIADITAILDQEKPDPARIAKAKTAADVLPPDGADAKKLAQFYYDRGGARSFLARNNDALADGKKALEVGKGAIDLKQASRIRQFVAMQYQQSGDPKRAMDTFQAIVRDGNQPGVRGTMISFLAQHRTNATPDGRRHAGRRVRPARHRAGVGSARQPHPNWRASYPIYGTSWESDADTARALIFEARGQYKEAEAAYIRAEAFRRASLKNLPKFEFPLPAGQVIISADQLLMSVAHVKAKQGRLSEAEADARKALLSVLKTIGKYHPAQPKFSIGLASILVDQGRYAEAEKLARSALEVQRTLGISEESPTNAGILSQLGAILTLAAQEQGGGRDLCAARKSDGQLGAAAP